MSDIVLRTSGLTSGYHGHPVISGISLEVRAGQMLGLLAPTGPARRRRCTRSRA
jgi:ABC-type multidrug transport system ATPase subunit